MARVSVPIFSTLMLPVFTKIVGGFVRSNKYVQIDPIARLPRLEFYVFYVLQVRLPFSTSTFLEYYLPNILFRAF